MGRWTSDSKIEPQFGDMAALRVGMEIPVLAVVEIVDAQGCAPLLVEAPVHSHIGAEIFAEGLIRKAVRVAVVQRAVRCFCSSLGK